MGTGQSPLLSALRLLPFAFCSPPSALRPLLFALCSSPSALCSLPFALRPPEALPLLSQLIRLPLKFVPKGLVVPFLSGPARGLKWVTGSGTHGCWLGTYEHHRQKQLTDLLKPGDCFLDIGANVGFYSVLASRIVGAAGQVDSFEPFPRNVGYLRKHIELNRLTNVTVHPIALSEGPDRTMTFATSINPSSGHLQRDGVLQRLFSPASSLLPSQGRRWPTGRMRGLAHSMTPCSSLTLAYKSR
jgi:hypothetical protein